MLEVGMTYSFTITVEPQMTAKSMKSGLLDVFATPMMIACMENCCLECVRPQLDEGMSTVGTAVDIKHVAATPVGMQVCFTCRLEEIDRRRLVFTVSANDEAGLIGEGRHERFIVDSKRFEEKCAAKLAQ